MPGGTLGTTNERVLEYAAVQLFLERARSAAPHLRLGPGDARHIGAICRQLDGMPLALELAAARIRALAPADLATRLDAPLNVLRAPGRSRPRQESLRAAISQSLLKRIGGGRIAAHEIMIGTPAIRNLIREGKIAQMYSAIQTGQKDGMQTLDQCLTELLQKGIVTKEEARFRAQNKDAF